jgi:hypothetical protein
MASDQAVGWATGFRFLVWVRAGDRLQWNWFLELQLQEENWLCGYIVYFSTPKYLDSSGVQKWIRGHNLWK